MLLQAAVRLLVPDAIPHEEPDEYLGEAGVSMLSRLKLILRRLAGQAVVLFGDLVTGARSRSEVVVTFLAVLELVRRHRVDASQEGLFAPIAITKPSAAPDGKGPAAVEPLEQVC